MKAAGKAADENRRPVAGKPVPGVRGGWRRPELIHSRMI
jgi:G2/mitotic-specific cyclin-B, other